MKVSKVVLIVIALHVLVIGGIFIFEGCSRSQKSTPGLADNETQPGDSSTSPVVSQPLDAMQPATPTVLTPPKPEVQPAAPATRLYTVKKGDSLWKIAKTEGTTIGDLSRVNNLTKTSVLKIGQKLEIPVAAPAESTAQATAVAATTAETGAAEAIAPTVAANIYTVKSGDSLWKIAQQQKVSVAAIKQANKLTSDTIKIGQKLQIPAPAASAEGASGQATSSLHAGMASYAADDGWRQPGTYSEQGQTIHIVDIGESPSTIAKKYGISTEDLMRVNNITDPRKVAYAQRLVIPLPQKPASETAPADGASSGTTPSTAPIVSASPTTVR